MGLSTLKPKEIDKALDENVVPWRKFHEDIVQSVAAALVKIVSSWLAWEVCEIERQLQHCVGLTAFP